MGVEFRLIKLLKRFGWCVIALLWCVTAKAYVEGGNWLVGLSGGYARHTGDMTIGIVYPAFNNLHIDQHANGNGDDWNKGLFFGYRWICNGWIWDGEFNVDLYQVEADVFFNIHNSPLFYTAKRRYKHGPAFGFTGRWGYTVSPCFFPYIVVGLETNKDKLEVTLEGTPPLATDPIVMFDAKQQIRGIAGFGTEMPLGVLCDQLSLRFEYRYYGMDKVLNPRGVLTTPIAGFNPEFSMALRPKFNAFKVALLWNFL